MVDSLLSEGLMCAINSCHMGITAEEIATRYHVSRADQDGFAVESQSAPRARSRTAASRRRSCRCRFRRGRAIPSLVETDEYPRAGTTVEALVGAQAGVQEGRVGDRRQCVGINDGAAALVVTTGEKARQIGTKPLARILSYASAGVDPKIMGMGPVPAVARRSTARLTIADIDLFELNEAFAVQSLAVSRELGLDPAKVNIHGGAVALGHPIGASGARILTTLVYALKARKLRYGVASLCIGGGMGIAMVVEAL